MTNLYIMFGLVLVLATGLLIVCRQRDHWHSAYLDAWSALMKERYGTGRVKTQPAEWVYPAPKGFSPMPAIAAEVDAALKRSIDQIAAMSPEEVAAMREAQRQSWARGEKGMGSDLDEAGYRVAARSEGPLLKGEELRARLDAKGLKP